MIGFIIPCWMVFALICSRELTALRTDSAPITSESPTTNNTELTESFSGYIQSGKAFRRQNSSFTAHGNHSRQSESGTPQTATGDQDRKLPRFLVSRLIIATMNQHPLNSGSPNAKNSADAQKNPTLKNNQPKIQVETNTVDPSDDTFATCTDNTIEDDTTESSKTSTVDNKKNSTNNPPIEVSLKDRSNFNADGCPTGFVKVDGKCVPIPK